MTLEELDLSKIYSYADYLKWQFEERVELIKGKIFKMSRPDRMHQEISGYLFLAIGNYLKGKQCNVYSAPFDVRLPRKSKDDNDIITVVQPDISVICNKSILDFKGCLGAPDIVVEILSPSNNVVELKNKYEIYEEAGIKEYWVVSPQDKTFLVYTLVNGRYVPSRLMVAGNVVHSAVLEGFSLDLQDMFDHLD
ncbi:MAG: Uma2 family endonuclease [Taibaiella sp.]|nr:Uma2 family endonuclease [Taibaiella sp.]